MPFIALPLPALGKSLSVFAATGYTSDAFGNLTAGVGFDVRGGVDEYDFEDNPEKENIVPMYIAQANHVIIREDWSLTVTEILADHTQVPSPQSSKLLALANLYQIMGFTWQQAGNIWGYFGTRGRITRAGRAGKNTVVMVFDHYARTDAPNPTYQ